MSRNMDEEQIYSGRLGRTSKTSVLISSHAGPVFPASVYTGINITQDENLLAALEDGSLNQIACPFDEHVYSLSIPVRYHDEDEKIFALIIPESLRHEEFKHRSDLLQELAKEREILPEYVRQFHTVFSYQEIQAILASRQEEQLAKSVGVSSSSAEKAGDETDEQGLTEKTETFGLGSSLGLSEESSSVLRPPPMHDAEMLRKREEVEQERMELSQLRAELELQREQLDEVSSRLERERSRMEEIEMSISTERSELDMEKQKLTQMRDTLLMERQQIEAQRLNLEQKERALQEGVVATPDEKTQVVTDDQFIEIVARDADDDEVDEVLDPGEILSDTPEDSSADVITSASLHQESRLDHASLPVEDDDFPAEESTQITQVPSLDHVQVKAEFDTSRAGAQEHYVRLVDGGVVASLRGSRKKIDALLDAEPVLFLQYALIQNYPVAVILLATLDEQDHLTESFGWLLDMSHDEDRQVLEQLKRESAIRFAFYNRQNKLLRTYDVKAPLEENVAWIMRRIEQHPAASKVGGFSKASEAFASESYVRLGSMKHPFTASSFDDIRTPEQAKLAAGIVGYWSTPDGFDYVIGNRAFPLQTLLAIQRRVAEAAIKQGIYLNQPLRKIALEAHMVDNERALCRRLMANFAEVSIGLKPSELDPLEIWENWDALFSLANEVGAQPEQDVIELAQASLRKAEEFQEDPQVHEQTQIMAIPAAAASESEPSEGEEEATALTDSDSELAPPSEANGIPLAMAMKLPQLKPSVQVEELVVARRSENTGVTYFLPDDDLLEQFDDMEAMSREDLSLLLEDSTGRLEAAQVLIERFGSEVVQDVLKASEEMLAAEVVGLAKFMESRADALEKELVKGVEEGGPSATYIGTYALAGLRSTSAIPVLLDALRDTRRSGNRKALSEALARYEGKLYTPLTNLIKRHGHDEAILDALVALDQRQPNTLAKASKDRHRRVRDASKAARKRLD